MKKILQSRITATILLIIVLTAQIASLVYVGFQKDGFHIDEIYTYILSNSYDATRISKDNKAMTSWNEGEYFDKFVVADQNELFSYDKVKYNNGLDAHPPLYYYLIHTVSSAFPETFSKWLGLAVNFVFFIGIQLVLYFLTLCITKNKYCSIAVIALNGGLTAIMDMAIFIRMYTLLTFFSVLFVYLNLLIYRNPEKKWLYVLTSVIAFLGIYTQYYFVFLTFAVGAALCLCMLKNRDFRSLFIYGLLILAAVALVFILYPAAIKQITGSETNNVGNEVSRNIFNFMALPHALLKMTRQILGGFASSFFHEKIIASAVVIITIIIAFIRRDKSDKNDQDKNLHKILLVLGAVIIAVIIIVTHISGKFTYLRYLYYLFPLISLFSVLFAVYIGRKIQIDITTLYIGIICFGLVGSVSFAKNDVCQYLFQKEYINDINIENQCQDKPLILISNGTTYHPTANFDILRNASSVYICDFTENADIDSILQEKPLDNGVVFMVLTDKEWSEGFNGRETMEEIVAESELLEDFQYFGKSTFSEIYISQ